MKSRGCALVCLQINHFHQAILQIPILIPVNKKTTKACFYRQLAAAVRPTSHNSGGLVFRVERAPASSILCDNLTGVALYEGKICSVLEETYVTHLVEKVEL